MKKKCKTCNGKGVLVFYSKLHKKDVLKPCYDCLRQITVTEMPSPVRRIRAFDSEIINNALKQFEANKFLEILASTDNEKILKLVNETKGAKGFAKYLIAQFSQQ